MSSLRNIARAIPRSLPGISVQCCRRTFAINPRASLLQQSWKLAPRSCYNAFSTSTIFRAKEGQVDQELAAKLHSELELEKDIRDSDQLPENIKSFLESSPFELHDIPGREEIVLKRRFGDEKIRISFTIADLSAMNEDDQYGDDNSQFDEEETHLSNNQSGGAQSKGTADQGRILDGNLNSTPEDRVAPADRTDDELPGAEDANSEEDPEPAFPARINVTIEKTGKGALRIDATAEDGQISVHNVLFYPKSELASAETAELDWSASELYSGPPFGNLDQDLQLLLERYLDERGINTELALWIPDYIDFKEQREYVNWLSNVKSFVDA